MGDWLIPDTFFFLNGWICCAIHDWMYRDKTARTQKDKDFADCLLQTNLNCWIEAKSCCSVIEDLRRYRATTYLNAVNNWGDGSFWCNGKAKP